jgi:hypothetical protein
MHSQGCLVASTVDDAGALDAEGRRGGVARPRSEADLERINGARLVRAVGGLALLLREIAERRAGTLTVRYTRRQRLDLRWGR